MAMALWEEADASVQDEKYVRALFEEALGQLALHPGHAARAAVLFDRYRTWEQRGEGLCSGLARD